MQYRHLGRSGLRISTIGFGTMTFGGAGFFASFGDTAGSAAERQIDICLEAGVNLFDTADIYSNGGSEELLAAALGKRRSQVIIATKAFGQTGRGPNDLGASRHHLMEACEASLRRLKTDHIDLYQIHNQDLATPTDETMRALDDLVRQGKVRYIGSSNHAGWTKMKALAYSERHGLARYVSQQIQYSLVSREAEHELLPMGVSEGVGAIVWGPLASGYLSGKFQQSREGLVSRLDDKRLSLYDTSQNQKILGLLAQIAADHSGATIAQVALNWIVRKGGVTSILVGARTEEQLLDNLAAARWSLSDEEIGLLDKASERPLPYPYLNHAKYSGGRNPLPAVQARPD